MFQAPKMMAAQPMPHPSGQLITRGNINHGRHRSPAAWATVRHDPPRLGAAEAPQDYHGLGTIIVGGGSLPVGSSAARDAIKEREKRSRYSMAAANHERALLQQLPLALLQVATAHRQ